MQKGTKMKDKNIRIYHFRLFDRNYCNEKDNFIELLDN